MKITPRRQQVLVRPIEEQKKQTDSGLIVPSTVEQEQKAMGEVIAVGSDIFDLQEKDTVIYGAFAGEKIKLKLKGKEVEYIILFDEDVLAIVCEDV